MNCDMSLGCNAEKMDYIGIKLKTGYHLLPERQYQLIKEFCLIKDNFVYIYSDQITNDILISTNKNITNLRNYQVILMTTYNNKNANLMDNISIALNHASAIVDWGTMNIHQVMRTGRKILSSRRKLWQYILKLLPAKVTRLYRMGVPTRDMSRALDCNSTDEIKQKILGMKNMHPKLMAMPPTWKKIAWYADDHLNNEFIDALTPLQILKIVKIHRQYPSMVSNAESDIISGKLSAKEFLNAIKYLNFAAFSPKMYSVVESSFRTIGLGPYLLGDGYSSRRPSARKQSYLTYKYLYAFIRRRGSANCTASYDLLSQYQ